MKATFVLEFALTLPWNTVLCQRLFIRPLQGGIFLISDDNSLHLAQGRAVCLNPSQQERGSSDQGKANRVWRWWMLSSLAALSPTLGAAWHDSPEQCVGCCPLNNCTLGMSSQLIAPACFPLSLLLSHDLLISARIFSLDQKTCTTLLFWFFTAPLWFYA